MKIENSKRGFIIFSMFFFVILLSGLAQASNTIHSDWYYSGDSFTADDDVFLVTHLDLYDPVVILQVNEVTYLIREGSCKLTATREYCIEEIFNDVENSDEDDNIKFEGGVVYAGIKVEINSRGPDLRISRDFSTTKPELNEEVVVDVEVENEGTESADLFYYQDTLPEDAFITSSSSGTDRTSRTVTYDAKILPGVEKTFTYKFKVTDYVEFTNKPIAWYSYEDEYTNVSISSKTIKISRPYTLDLTVSPESLETADQAALSFKINNEVSDDIEVTDFKLTIPGYLSVQVKPGEMEKVGRDYIWSGTLESGEYKRVNFVVTPQKSGEYNVSASIEVTDADEKEFSETDYVIIKSKIKDITPILSIIDESVSEGSDFRLAFSLKNPNAKVGFRDMKGTISSELFPDMEFELDVLPPGKTETLIVNDTLAAPFLDEEKKFVINASGTYESTTSEDFDFSETKNLKVTPVAEAISIIQSFSKNEVDAGKNVSVTIKIKNNNEEAIQVNVSDEYPDDLDFVGGKAKGTVFFEEAGTEVAYVYNLRIPLDYNKTELEVTTTAKIQGKEEIITKSESFTIIPAEPVDEEPEEEPLPEYEPEPEKEKAEKTNFFAKVIDEITNFFRRLLGVNKE